MAKKSAKEAAEPQPELDQTLLRINRTLSQIEKSLASTADEAILASRLYTLGAERNCKIFFADRVFNIPVHLAEFENNQRRYVLTNALENETAYRQLEDLEILAQGKTILNIGAGMGVSSVALNYLCNPKKMHLFEPQSCLQEHLQETMERNDIKDFEIHKTVIGEEGKNHDMGAQNPSNLLKTRFVVRRGGKYVARSIDSYKFKDVAVIHMEMDTTKMHILRGAEQTIKEQNPIILSDNTARDIKEQREFLEAMDYKYHKIGDRLNIAVFVSPKYLL